MGASTKQCPHCSTAVEQENRFCPECGKPLPSIAPAPAAAEPKKPSFKGTMLAYQSPDEPAPKPVEPPPQTAAKPSFKGTMLAYQSPNEPPPKVVAEPQPVEAPPPPPPTVATTESEKASVADNSAAVIAPPVAVTPAVEPAPVKAEPPPKVGLDRSKTILGLAGQNTSLSDATQELPTRQLLEAPVQPAAPEPRSIQEQTRQTEGGFKPRARTIFGMPSITSAEVEKKAAAASAQTSPSPAASAPSGPSSSVNRSAGANRTILGIPKGQQGGKEQAVLIKGQQAGPEKTSLRSPTDKGAAGRPAPAPDTGRTILGVASGFEEALPPEPSTDDIDSNVLPARSNLIPRIIVEEDEVEEVEPKRGRKGRMPAGLIAVIALLIAAVVAGAAFLLLKEKPSNVRAGVVMMESGEGLRFEAPAAPAGSKIRFGGQEKSLEAGRATFLLAADSVRAGENVVMFDLLSPDGTTHSDTITLSVDFRIRVDTAPLQTAEPAIDVLVNALPGAAVTLDGKPLTLDAQGRGVRRYPIDPARANANGIVEHVVRYRVQPASGEATVDELRTKIPIASMQIDRPGLEAVTDKTSIEIAGAVSSYAQVSVDSQPVAVQAGRFLHRLSLPQVGAYRPKVIAQEKGKAPRAITLNIRRVADLKKEAVNFKADPSLTYARIAQNPAIYSGQKIALEGRVFNVNVQNGQSVLQVLVRECPSGTRCSVWVTYPFATDAVVDSWVRILGSIEGQQQFRSENNRVVTVPKITATYVLSISG